MAGKNSFIPDLKSLSGGTATNIPVGTEITWTSNKPAGLAAKAVVVSQVGYEGRGFSGGYDGESDADLVQRIEDAYADRAGAGNAAQMHQWAQAASSGVEQAFVYPCALHAGSTLVSPTQSRDQTVLAGPSGRLPTAALIADVTAQLTPPGSPVVPETAYVLVVAPNGQPVDLVVRVAMTQGAGAGWHDPVPWPNPTVGQRESDTEVVAVVSVASGTSFVIETATGLPGGASSLSDTQAPAMMVWAESASRFERLDVASVSSLGSNQFRVILHAAPDHVIAVDDRISPYTDRAEEIAVALEQYFDLLGPAEVVELSDSRWARAARRPFPSVRFPMKIGTSVAVAIADMLRTAASDVTGSYTSRTRARRFAGVVGLASAITCGNRYLASLVPQGNRNVYLYPSPVPTAVPTRNYGEGAGRFRFGWIGGGGNLTSLARIGPALQSLAQNQPLVLRVISDREFTLPGVCVESVPWSLAGQAAALARLDVGLMPLDGTSPFDRGKCSYKVLQYMAAGVVPVGSAVGMNTEVIEDGMNGRLVQSEAEWGRVLAELRNLDGQELSIMGAAARSTALTGFGYEVLAGGLARFFREVVSRFSERRRSANLPATGRRA